MKFAEKILKRGLICLLAYLSYALGMSLNIYASSRFLSKIGADYLPYIMVGAALFTIIFALLNTFLGNRISAPKRFMAMLFLLLVLVTIFSVLNLNVDVDIVLLLLLANFLLTFFDISLFNVVNSFITPLEAKSYLPMVSSFISLGIITGSYLVPRVQEQIDNFGMNKVVIALTVIIIIVMGLIIKIFKKDVNAETTIPHPQKKQTAGNILKGIKYVFTKSNLLRLLAFFYILNVAVQLLTEFKVKTNFAASFNKDELTQMIGLMYMLSSAANFFAGLFLTKKLLFRFGVSNMLISFPVISLTVLIIAAILGFSPMNVLIYYLAFAIPFYSYVPVAASQIFSLTPKDIHEGVYFTIRGVVTSLSGLLISLSLMAYSSHLEFEKSINTLVIAVLILIMLFVLIKMKRAYFQELKKSLFNHDIFLRHQAIDLLAEKNYKESGELFLRRLMDSRDIDSESRFKTIYSLAVIGNYRSIVDMIKVLDGNDIKEKFAALRAIKMIMKKNRNMKKYPVTAHLLLKTYKKIFISDVPQYVKSEVISSLKYFDLNDVIGFLEESLKSEDYQIQINAIETLKSFNDRAISIYVEPMMKSPNLHVVAGAIAALWQFEEKRIVLIPRIAMLMDDTSDEATECSLYIIRMIGASWELKYVMKQFSSSNRHFHIYATLVLIQMGYRNYMVSLLREWLSLLKDTHLDYAKPEIEFILSQYRRFSNKMKEKLLLEISKLPQADVDLFRKCFAESNYIFTNEVRVLS